MVNIKPKKTYKFYNHHLYLSILRHCDLFLGYGMGDNVIRFNKVNLVGDLVDSREPTAMGKTRRLTTVQRQPCYSRSG